MRGGFKRFAWLLWMAAVGAVGCDAGSDRLVDVLDVRMIGVQARRTMQGVSTSPLAGVKVVRLGVEGPGMEPLSRMFDFLADDGGRLPAFPLGPDRQVTVELCSRQCDPNGVGDIVSRGRSVPATLVKGDHGAQDVFVAPRNAMVPPVFLSEDGQTAQVSAMVHKERLGATVTGLDDGRLLIVGGARRKSDARTWYMPDDIDRVFDAAEIFDPGTGRFRRTSGSLSIGRAFHQAVKLGGPNRKDGRVVIIGGLTQESGSIKPSASIEIFDPALDRFESVPIGLVGGGRALFTADLALADQGIILILGGLSDPDVVGGTWHLYLPGTGTVGAGALMGSTNNQTGQVRYNHTMTRVEDYGGVPGAAAYVVIGGENQEGTVADVEAFLVERNPLGILADPETVATLPMGGRTLHSAVAVPSLGLVFVIGGFMGRDLVDPTDRIEIFGSGNRSFYGATGMLLGTARGAVAAVRMDDASILVAGGVGSTGPLGSTDVLTVNQECWQEGDPPVERCGRVPRVLSDRTPVLDTASAGLIGVFDATRRVLMLGGITDGGLVPDPILYNPE